MVKDHSDNEIGNPLLILHGQGFLFNMHHPLDRIAPTTAFVTPGALAGTRNIAQWVHHEGSIR